jgi:DNA-directed DNA polymerase III PolC
LIPYSELHLHSHYSALDGLSTPAEYCKRANELGIKSLALTDHGTTSGHRDMQKATLESGIKPVLGVEAYFTDDRFDKRSNAKRTDGDTIYNHILLLAKNNTGVRALNELSEIGFTEGFYNKPRIDLEVIEPRSNDLICLSGCMNGPIAKALLNGRYDKADDYVKQFLDVFGSDFFIEIQSHNPAALNLQLLSFADAYNIRPVLTGDCHYSDPKDKWIEEAFLILSTNPKKIEDADMSKMNKMEMLEKFNYLYPERVMSFQHIDVFLESQANRQKAMLAQGIDRMDIYSNTVDITDSVYEYEFKSDLDTLPRPVGKDTDRAVRDICAGAMKRLGFAGKPEYEKRLEEELEVILGKNFSVYFIILWDLMKYCRQEKIVTGFARGSAGGSLVSYLMQITELDPIKYGLLFWRFLDPSREEAPDIDLDIEDKRRAEVKRYLEDKYGIENVASISTFTYYQDKAAVKAACRVLGVKFTESNEAVKDMETIEDYERLASLTEFRAKYPDVGRLALALRGRLSGFGMHPAGVVITDQPITKYIGVESRGVIGEEFRQRVVAADKKTAENIGLVKIDLLGLKALSVISDTVALIDKNHGETIDFKRLKTDDEAVFQMLSDGYTLGVFQAEQSASTKLIKDMGVKSFDDLVASNALVRSGAWNAFGPEFLARKKGHKKVKYPTPESEWFLGETQGLALYQEQSMLICTEIAGMSMGDANAVRKITARKSANAVEQLEPYKAKFMTGAVNQITKAAAEKLWKDIEGTAEYQFNKCLKFDTTVMYWNRTDGSMGDDSIENVKDWVDRGDDVWVLGPDLISGEKVEGRTYHKIAAVHDNGVQDCMRIWINERDSISATFMHKHRLAKSWKEAYRIHQNDVIWTVTGKKKVAGRRYDGQFQTYDLELANEPHAFYANGILTHNSHSVGYSRLSYVCAWLKYYYPHEYLVGLLNNEGNVNSITEYFSECKRLGIEVKPPHVNYSEKGFSTKNGKIYLGLSNIKYISDKLSERIIMYRPYADYNDLVEKIMVKGSGLSSRVLGSLNAVGASEFPDHPIDPEEVANNFYEYLGIPSFDSGMVTEKMRERITGLVDYNEKGTQIVLCIVNDITSKNGWTRISVVDGEASASFFADEKHGLSKGHRYLLVLANNSLVDYVDLAEYTSSNPIIRFLQGGMDDHTYIIGAKARTTRNNKRIATVVFSHRSKPYSALVFESNLDIARRVCLKGAKVDLALKQTKDGTTYLDNARAAQQQ